MIERLTSGIVLREVGLRVDIQVSCLSLDLELVSGISRLELHGKEVVGGMEVGLAHDAGIKVGAEDVEFGHIVEVGVGVEARDIERGTIAGRVGGGVVMGEESHLAPEVVWSVHSAEGLPSGEIINSNLVTGGASSGEVDVVDCEGGVAASPKEVEALSC